MAYVRTAVEALRCVPPGERLLRIAELRERYRRAPAAFTADDVEALRELALEARIAELEKTPRRCRRGHKMEIREGPRGHFWGCGAYPFCHHVTLLSREEWQYLRRMGGRPAGLGTPRQMALI